MKHLNNQELQSALDKAMKLIGHQSTYTQDRLKMPAYIDKLQAEQIKRAEMKCQEVIQLVDAEKAHTDAAKTVNTAAREAFEVGLHRAYFAAAKNIETKHRNPPSDGFIPKHMILEPLFRSETHGNWEDQNNLLYDDDPLFDTQAFHRMMGISCVDYGVEE